MFIYSPADCSSLTSINLDDIASKTGLVRRRSPKFSPSCFLQSLLSAVISGQASLSQIAAGLGLRVGKSLSKQALQKRFDQPSSAFLTEVIAKLALSHFRSRISNLDKRGFTRILVEDSSFCSMHRGNADDFPAHGNGQVDTAGFKMDLCYDLLTDTLESSTFHGATEQDKSIGKNLVNNVRPGDLVLRDMGYFVVSEFVRIEELGACWLSRLPVHTKISVDGGNTSKALEEVLGKTDRNQRTIDLRVKLSNAKLGCRLVAVRAKKSIIKKRRKERLKAGLKKSKTEAAIKSSLGWKRDGWHILVSNVEEALCGAYELMKIYRMRWDIEIQFRGWKQSLNMKKALGRSSSVHHMTALALTSMIHQILTMHARARLRTRMKAGELSAENLSKVLSQWMLRATHFEECWRFDPDIRHVRKDRRKRITPVAIKVAALG